MSDRVVENMLAGYAFVDALLAAGVDVFAMGNLKGLAGAEHHRPLRDRSCRREQYARHREATERRFYEERDGRHPGRGRVVRPPPANDSVWNRAAGAFVRVLSTPQLFVEGNHRTGALLMSYILMGDGQPPFVLSPENAAAYFEPSAAIQGMHKRGTVTPFALSTIRRRLAQLLLDHGDRKHLLPATSA